jgi:hypothetical protein
MMRGPRCISRCNMAKQNGAGFAFLQSYWEELGPRPAARESRAPRPIEAKRRKSLILKDFPRIAAAGFSAEDKDHVSNKHWSFFFICKIFKNFY